MLIYITNDLGRKFYLASYLDQQNYVFSGNPQRAMNISDDEMFKSIYAALINDGRDVKFRSFNTK